MRDLTGLPDRLSAATHFSVGRAYWFGGEAGRKYWFHPPITPHHTTTARYPSRPFTHPSSLYRSL